MSHTLITKLEYLSNLRFTTINCFITFLGGIILYYFSGRNITESFYNSLEGISDNGHTFQTIKGKVKELTPVMINIKKPNERCLVIPHRYNNIIATLAETLWVLGGRDDILYLEKYLPRAKQFSDDGITWSSAYGKRLLNWYGINQIKEVTNQLKGMKYSRRAVMCIFDPQKDFDMKARQVPCNNLIQPMITGNNKLNFNVSLRANDVMWGFSGINFFQWSILQELLAGWLNVEVGEYYHFVGSFNLFERHFNRTKKILEERISNDIYSSYTDITPLKVDINEQHFDELMKKFFVIEEKLNKTQNIDSLIMDINSLDSQFLANCLKLLLCNYLYESENYDNFLNVFETVYNDHLKIAAAELFKRKSPDFLKEELSKTFDLW